MSRDFTKCEIQRCIQQTVGPTQASSLVVPLLETFAEALLEARAERDSAKTDYRAMLNAWEKATDERDALKKQSYERWQAWSKSQVENKFLRESPRTCAIVRQERIDAQIDALEWALKKANGTGYWHTYETWIIERIDDLKKECIKGRSC